MVPWKEGEPLAWDLTVVCRLNESYIDSSATDVGSAAELAAGRKEKKYAIVNRTHFLQPIVRPAWLGLRRMAGNTV